MRQPHTRNDADVPCLCTATNLHRCCALPTHACTSAKHTAGYTCIHSTCGCTTAAAYVHSAPCQLMLLVPHRALHTPWPPSAPLARLSPSGSSCTGKVGWGALRGAGCVQMLLQRAPAAGTCASSNAPRHLPAGLLPCAPAMPPDPWAHSSPPTACASSTTNDISMHHGGPIIEVSLPTEPSATMPARCLPHKALPSHVHHHRP